MGLALLAKLLGPDQPGVSRCKSELKGHHAARAGLPRRAERFTACARTGVFVALCYVGRRQRVVAWPGLAAASGLSEVPRNFIPGRAPLFDARASASGLTRRMAVGALLKARAAPRSAPNNSARAVRRQGGGLARRSAAGMAEKTIDQREATATARYVR